MRWSLISSRAAKVASALLASGTLLASSASAQFDHDAADKAEGYNTRREENAHGSLRSAPQGADTGDYDIYPNQDYSNQPSYQNQNGRTGYAQSTAQYSQGQSNQGQFSAPYGQQNANQQQYGRGQYGQTNRQNQGQYQAQYGNRNQGQGSSNWQNWQGQDNQGQWQHNQQANQQDQWNNQAGNRRAYSSNHSSWNQDQSANQDSQNSADRGVSFSSNDGRLTANRVSQNSLLGQAGLRRGDQIESVNGQQVRSQNDLRQVLRSVAQAALVVLRDGQRHTLNVNQASQGNWNQNQSLANQQHQGQQYQGQQGPGQQAQWSNQHPQQQYGNQAYAQHPAGNQQYGNQYGGQQAGYSQNQQGGNFAQHAGMQQGNEMTVTSQLGRGAQGQAFLGVQFDQQHPNEAVVTQVYRGSPAEQAGLQPGDVLVAVNGQQISSPNQVSHVIGQLSPGTQVQLVVERHQINGGRAQMGNRNQGWNNQPNGAQGQQGWNQGNQQGFNQGNQQGWNRGNQQDSQDNQGGSRYQAGYRGAGRSENDDGSPLDPTSNLPEDHTGDVTDQ